MRVLSVRQPWAWQIIHQGKNIENRSRNFVGSYRGPVAIHASLKPDQEALARLPKLPPPEATGSRIFYYGEIIGIVDLVDVHPSNGGCCRPWGQGLGVHHLVMTNPRPMKRGMFDRGAIKVGGKLGLWRPDEALTAQILAGEVKP